jgi:hypothetical protein
MMNIERAGWYVALITGVLALLTFLGLDKSSRAWVCRNTDGKALCDKIAIDEVQVKLFALDYCYLHAEECPNNNTVSTAPLADTPLLASLQEDLRSINNPDWENNPPDNLRFYVPSQAFPSGTGRKYLLYWELDFRAPELDHPVTLRVQPYFYLPPPPGSEGYYGDPYDKTYLQNNTVNFVLKPGQTRLSHLLSVNSGQTNRLEDVNDWPMGAYWIKFGVTSDQAILQHELPIDNTFTVVPYYTYAPTPSVSSASEAPQFGY